MKPQPCDGLGQRIDHARLRQHIIGARGARLASGCGKSLGRTSTSSLERHVLHGARAGADIARVRGFNQDDADQRMLSSACMQPLLNIAVRAARRAGEIIVRSMSRLDSLQIASKGRNDFVTRSRPRRRTRDHRHHPQGVSRSCHPRRGKRRKRRGRYACGSSIRSTARRTSCMATRSSASRSPASTRASSSTASSTIRCARSCSPPRAAAARTSTTTACASASSARSKAR